MIIKKNRGKIFGADFNASEKKAIEIEINRQLADITRKHLDELDAMVLWYLHEEFGFGKKRLYRFYKNFAPLMEELSRRYEMVEVREKAWICTEKLKEYGIDLEEWTKKIEEERGENM